MACIVRTEDLEEKKKTILNLKEDTNLNYIKIFKTSYANNYFCILYTNTLQHTLLDLYIHIQR